MIPTDPDGVPLMGNQVSPEAGKGIVRSPVASLGRKAKELLAAYRGPVPPDSPVPGNPDGALTFDEVERIWAEEIEPMLPGFVSMRLRDGQAPADSASPWFPDERSNYLGSSRSDPS